MSSQEQDVKVPIVIAPPEISQLYSRLDAIDERIEFVLGEVAQKEGLRIGAHIGFLYGFLVGSMVMLILKFILGIL
ncbi:MAG: tetrahydromethanopterin S-methyltransferase subunit G [Candidatus Nezhaarchaeota archaeon]|nr:tetrahydromethanopterin S-methyltransferase subunit G [Candidatus Nezhaarchaeota archaeon]MCX8141477.1 tetrahydromethanopterin S-methyltransferase subunit G [Candidatus Nezhaarchaeota archaeon]MDW8049743.1 tetrahydromethanopterin S-methyltransferase subunit G [Nitrososphaerota archaeon]